MDPQTLIPLGALALAGLIWLIRLEGKVNAAIKAGDDTGTDFYKHLGDRTIHVPESDLNRRFDEFHADLGEIKSGMKDGFVEVNRRLDTVISK